MKRDLRYCSPTADTKKFAVVLGDWSRLKLNGNGNQKAALIVETAGKRGLLHVIVNGVLNQNTIEVGAIATAAATATTISRARGPLRL